MIVKSMNMSFAEIISFNVIVSTDVFVPKAKGYNDHDPQKRPSSKI